MAEILSIVLPLIGCIASDWVWPALSLALYLLMCAVRIFEFLQGVFCHRAGPVAPSFFALNLTPIGHKIFPSSPLVRS